MRIINKFMPNYDVRNKKNGKVKEIFCSYKDKEKTLKELGPNWEWVMTSGNVNYQGVMSATRRAGSGWNDVLKGIKKASGRKGNTIQHD
tara:strand:+ start:553 stop:819 length:267 start_codon:yes stop_codon:yes gene_type:complete